MQKLVRSAVLIAAAAVVLGVAVSPLSADGHGYRDEGLKRLNTIEEKVVGLAEAMPAEKYTWRPAEGVRSVSEVNLHVAGANFGLSRFLGTPPPEGFAFRGYDKSTTDKTKIIAALKESFAHFRKAVEQLSAAAADKPVKMFGQDTTTRGALLMALEHLSEHMGQSIAYARVNGVTPPWSQ